MDEEETQETSSPAYDALNDMQKRFVDAYLGEAGGDASRAARLAGYAEIRGQAGYQVKNRPKVRAAIEERTTGLAIGAGLVLGRLAQQALALQTAYIRVRSVHIINCPDCKGIGGCEECGKTGKICAFCRDASDKCDGLKHGGESLAWIDLHGLDEAGLKHLIRGIKWDRNGNQIVEFHDAQKALELLGRHHRLFADRMELTGADGSPLAVKVLRDVSMDDL